MLAIDTHIHFWDLANEINNWVFEMDNPELIKNHLPQNAIDKFQEDLYGVVHVEAHDSKISTITEITWLVDAIKQTPNLKYRHIACIDLTLNKNEFSQIVDKLLQYKDVIGVRHILAYNPKFGYSPCATDLSNHPNIYSNLDFLAKNNLIFDCQMYPYQLKNILPAIIDSGITCVIDHALLPAWNVNNDSDHKLWKEMILQIAKIDNIFIKLSGIDMFRKKTEFNRILKFCLANFPTSRLMYASNYPVSFTNDYNYWYNKLDSMDLTYEEKKQIFFTNAKYLFFK